MSIMRCKSASSVDLDKLVLMLSNRNIEARRVWKPLHEMPAYAEFPRLSLQNSADCYLTDLCLPSSVGSNSAEINYVCKSLDKIFSGL
jgi:pyridoxal phosphate-dependent aminotransferase EpsN